MRYGREKPSIFEESSIMLMKKAQVEIKILWSVMTVLLTLCPVFASASSVVNLRCNVKSVYTLSNGEKEQKLGVALLEVETIGPHLGIQISSDIDMLDSVSAWSRSYENDQFSSTGENRSTQNKWEVIQESSRKSDGMSSYKKIVIDRVSGTLIVQYMYSRPNRTTSLLEVSGQCEKSSGKNLF